jgi:hypothetical protein
MVLYAGYCWTITVDFNFYLRIVKDGEVSNWSNCNCHLFTTFSWFPLYYAHSEVEDHTLPIMKINVKLMLINQRKRKEKKLGNVQVKQLTKFLTIEFNFDTIDNHSQSCDFLTIIIDWQYKKSLYRWCIKSLNYLGFIY